MARGCDCPTPLCQPQFPALRFGVPRGRGRHLPPEGAAVTSASSRAAASSRKRSRLSRVSPACIVGPGDANPLRRARGQSSPSVPPTRGPLGREDDAPAVFRKTPGASWSRARKKTLPEKCGCWEGRRAGLKLEVHLDRGFFALWNGGPERHEKPPPPSHPRDHGLKCVCI